jgi:hypothetical protein
MRPKRGFVENKKAVSFPGHNTGPSRTTVCCDHVLMCVQVTMDRHSPVPSSCVRLLPLLASATETVLPGAPSLYHFAGGRLSSTGVTRCLRQGCPNLGPVNASVAADFSTVISFQVVVSPGNPHPCRNPLMVAFPHFYSNNPQSLLSLEIADGSATWAHL